jgi:hypothetical protein
MKVAIVWGVTPCSLVDNPEAPLILRVEEHAARDKHYLGQRVPDVSEERAPYILNLHLSYSLALSPSLSPI